MMKITAFTLVALASAVAPSVNADQALAQSKGCLHCHSVEKAIVGPAYKDVAKKYAGQNVTAQLAQKVMKGGSGVWGSMAMPPNAVTPEEAKQLVEWVLSQK